MVIYEAKGLLTHLLTHGDFTDTCNKYHALPTPFGWRMAIIKRTRYTVHDLDENNNMWRFVGSQRYCTEFSLFSQIGELYSALVSNCAVVRYSITNVKYNERYSVNVYASV